MSHALPSELHTPCVMYEHNDMYILQECIMFNLLLEYKKFQNHCDNIFQANTLVILFPVFEYDKLFGTKSSSNPRSWNH